MTIKPIFGMDAGFQRAIRSADIIVDDIFEVGLNRPIHGRYCAIIHAMNEQDSYLLPLTYHWGWMGQREVFMKYALRLT